MFILLNFDYLSLGRGRYERNVLTTGVSPVILNRNFHSGWVMRKRYGPSSFDSLPIRNDWLKGSIDPKEPSSRK